MRGNYYLDMTNVFLDGAAMFVLLGLIYYTSLYRRRGKTEDKLFFTLVLLAVIYAVTEGTVSLLNFVDFWIGRPLFLVELAFTYLIYESFAMVWCVYVAFRNGWHKGKERKYIPLLCLPGLIMIVVVIINLFTGFLYVYDNTYMIVENSPLVYVAEIPILIGFVFTFAVIVRYYRRGAVLLIATFVICTIFWFFIDRISCIPIMMSIVLIYSHLYAMKEPFYEAEAKS